MADNEQNSLEPPTVWFLGLLCLPGFALANGKTSSCFKEHLKRVYPPMGAVNMPHDYVPLWGHYQYPSYSRKLEDI